MVKATKAAERLGRYWERLVDAALLGVPIALIDRGRDALTGSLLSQPWHIVWFIVPLSVAAWILWRTVTKRGSLQVRGRMLFFLLCYLSVFTLAAASDLLVWRRTTVAVDEGQSPRNWLLPARWGDWRYWLARKGREQHLVIVTMNPPSPGATLESLRLEIARLIQLAANGGARGIAFDFYLQDSSSIDAFLCAVVRNAGIPVIMGQRVRKSLAEVLAVEPYPNSLGPCFPRDRRGSLLGYADADGVIRHIVLRISDNPDSAALSLTVATQLLGVEPSLKGFLLQYLEPQERFHPLQYEELAQMKPEDVGATLNGHFIIVGERSRAETFHTPYGDRLGVEVHAAAISSLLGGEWIVRPTWWSVLLIIVVACYLITALAAAGAPVRKLLAVALGVTAFVIAGSVLAIRLWRVWLDVVYPLVAVWLLLVLVLALRRRMEGTAR